MLVRLWFNLRADRQRPPLRELSAIDDPERFLWNILPHAARTFALCIVLLPKRMTRALAVAYLYCRMLDTYEDLAPGRDEQVRRLRAFVQRFADDGTLSAPAEPLEARHAPDDRERTHVLLVQRCALIDETFLALPAAHRRAIVRLVRRMGRGMIWSSDVFAQQGGSLASPGQLAEYCWNVLGTTLLFAEEIARLDRGFETDVEPERLRACADAGEAIQLANVTRDVDKDLTRGVRYHPELAGLDVSDVEAVRRARWDLLRRAFRKAASFEVWLGGLPFGRISRARGAACLLILTTWGYYQRAARKAGLAAWPDEAPLSRARGLMWYVAATGSRRMAARLGRRVTAAFGEASRRLAGAPRPFVDDDGGFDVVEVVERASAGEPSQSHA